MTRVLLMLMIAMAARQNAAQTPRIPDPEVRYAIKGAQHLRFLVRDPESFELTLALITDSGNVCYQYRARNSFGRTDADTAVFPKSARKLADDQDSGFLFTDSSDWERYCVQGTTFKWRLREGKNVTEDVKKALKASEQ